MADKSATNHTEPSTPTPPTINDGLPNNQINQLLADLEVKCTTQINETRASLTIELASAKTEILELQRNLKIANDKITQLTMGFQVSDKKITALDLANANRLKLDIEHTDALREKNIIIRGIPEERDEKLHETVNNLLKSGDASFGFSGTQGGFRIGKKPAPDAKPRYPRNIKLMLSSRAQKSEMFGLRKKMATNNRYNKLQFTDDQSSSIMLATKSALQVASRTCQLGKEKVRSAKTRGTSVVINDVVYKSDQLTTDLPFDLNPDMASTIEIQGGTAFQGHNSFLSNFYPVKINGKDGHTYQSAEQYYTAMHAEHANLPSKKSSVQAEFNPFYIKGISKQIPSDDLWKRKRGDVLREVVKTKFDQSPKIKARLLALKGDSFYECTKDPKYGCGRYLQDADKCVTPLPGYKNEMGTILEELKHLYMQLS